MKDWHGHKHGEYNDECPICYLDRELDKAEEIIDKYDEMLERKDQRIAELEVELSDFQDLQLCDCCKGLFETCHDAEGHMQCERCTKQALREDE
jgi:hypothetical protein